ncbi:choline dehydrogenase-like flavoprotein [Chitinophaga skermanii]|uniref:Choline dehydrogenase-like flavoprotein n=1 Tax=Chitinophaga skermanii TaxID=331697 RepID=A0A327QSF8_9BACT|nr:GMC family oxidoreductase [Chitinophaga skermanii]RAJ06888.1 choline dehydrogenase-like flavoprotein [Chitinophaga skermanii]
MNLNIKAEKENTYDAIVVGSGISGGWAAKELSEKGLKTLVLERGRNIVHGEGYTTAMKDPWEFEHHLRITNEMKAKHPIQSQCYAFDESTVQHWVNDLENPYNQVKPFNWLRGYHVGGRSLMWGRQVYRWSDLDFEANAKDGHGVDWPIRYKDLEPWYTYVEKFAGVSGQAEGLPQLPDGVFLPPMDMNCLEKHVAKRFKDLYNDRIMTIGRVAHATKAIDHRKCQFRNLCARGCPFTGYFSSNGVTLPAAAKTGNMTLRPHSIVLEVLYDDQTQKAKGVRIMDSETKEVIEYYAKIVFLNASTLGSTWILLNSKSDRFPEGFGNDSGQVGHNLMDHHYGVWAWGNYEGFEDQYYDAGRRPNGIYIPRFRNTNEKTKRNDYVRGFGYQGGAARGRVNIFDGIGADFKDAQTVPGGWGMSIGAWGEHLPYYDNKVSLNHEKKDVHGLPTLDIDCEFKENEIAMRKDMLDSAKEMLEKAGLKNVGGNDDMPPPGHCIHEMGTARMGRDPKTSVLNAYNQVHAAKNVFITDGACMPSSACQNPSITYMALTARAADHAVSELKKNNL